MIEDLKYKEVWKMKSVRHTNEQFEELIKNIPFQIINEVNGKEEWNDEMFVLAGASEEDKENFINKYPSHMMYLILLSATYTKFGDGNRALGHQKFNEILGFRT